MKTIKWLVAFFALALLGSAPAWADHHHGGRFHFGVMIGAPVWGWGYPPPPPYYYYPPYYPPYNPPVVVERQAPVYVEQAPPPVAAPAPAAPAPQNFWYYCAAAKGYYPYVKECPSGWQQVSPQPAQP